MSTKEKATWLTAGPVVFFTGLWVGAYVFGNLPLGHWASMPTWLSAIIMCAAGVVITAVALKKMTD